MLFRIIVQDHSWLNGVEHEAREHVKMILNISQQFADDLLIVNFLQVSQYTKLSVKYPMSANNCTAVGLIYCYYYYSFALE